MLTRGGLEEARAKGVGDSASLGSHVVCCARLNSSWDTIAGNAFGALTTVSGSLRPQKLVPLRRSGVGQRGSHRKPVLGNQSLGAGEGRELPLRAVQPERRGQAPLPHHPAIKGEPRGCFAKAQPSGVDPRACGDGRRNSFASAAADAWGLRWTRPPFILLRPFAPVLPPAP